MSRPPLDSRSIDRYLSMLGVPRASPDIDGLTRLVKAHTCHVPFENISKLYYKKHTDSMMLPDIETYLEGMERFNFGGTCYAMNYYFNLLLESLGYSVMLCGADMANPDVHLVSIVDMDHRSYLVDVGYAAPFSAPLPRDLTTDYVICLGSGRYVLKPQDKHGVSRLDFYRDGILKHGYRAKPVAKRIDEFHGVIAHSYGKNATFMNALLLARFCPDRSVIIHNLRVSAITGGVTTDTILDCPEELPEIIYDYFRIPRNITSDILRDLHDFGDAWS